MVKPYSKHLKRPARSLRQKMNQPEKLLWQRIRRKQLHCVQFGLGLTVLRFSNQQVLQDLKSVIESVEQKLAKRLD